MAVSIALTSVLLEFKEKIIIIQNIKIKKR